MTSLLPQKNKLKMKTIPSYADYCQSWTAFWSSRKRKNAAGHQQDPGGWLFMDLSLLEKADGYMIFEGRINEMPKFRLDLFDIHESPSPQTTYTGKEGDYLARLDFVSKQYTALFFEYAWRLCLERLKEFGRIHHVVTFVDSELEYEQAVLKALGFEDLGRDVSGRRAYTIFRIANDA